MATRHTKTFVAYDASGREWTIHEYTEFIASRTRAGVQEAPGLKSFQTDQGLSVNPLEPYDGKRFLIVSLRLGTQNGDPKTGRL
jgi:hypothetical protein